MGSTALSIPQFVLLAAETEPGTAGRGALRKTVPRHPDSEWQVISTADDGVHTMFILLQHTHENMALGGT